MILVTVGTEKFPFHRLMCWIDVLIAQGILSPEQEEIVVQYGNCTILPAGVSAYRVLPASQFKELIQRARLIISHCGEGTINTLFEQAKPFILVPRSFHFGEHLDNHQVELAEALATRDIPIAYAPADLIRFLAAPSSPFQSVVRDYQIFTRWGARCPVALRNKRYTYSVQQRTARSLCHQLKQRFDPNYKANPRTQYPMVNDQKCPVINPAIKSYMKRPKAKVAPFNLTVSL